MRKIQYISAIMIAALVSLLFVQKNSTQRQPSSTNQLRDINAFLTLNPSPQVPKHVVMLHLDGFRADVFQKLLDNHQLPHFEFLLNRGKVSYKTSTVDKSETFKVIESYLTSRRDTYITGWWQFSRKTLDFRNYWLDPDQVLNYAIGTEFPVYPTVLDFLSAKGENVISGFGLHRRGVSFENYGRAYYEGLKAALGEYTYFNQASATIAATRRIYERIASGKEKTPALNFSLLAPADEFGHWLGIAAPKDLPIHTSGEYCIQRYSEDEKQNKINEILFEQLSRDENMRSLSSFYFTKVKKEIFGNPRELCFTVPKADIFARPLNEGPVSYENTPESLYVQPHYALGMMMADYHLGELIESLRSIRFNKDGSRFFVNLSSAEHAQDSGILNYIRKIKSHGQAEDSLFENTLFVLFGDHGMGDTKYMMWPQNPHAPDMNRNPNSYDEKFIEYLNRQLGLETMSTNKALGRSGGHIGVDYQTLPQELNQAFLDESWMSPDAKAQVLRAKKFSSYFYNELTGLAKDKIYQSSFFIKLLWPVAKAQVNEKFHQYRLTAENVLSKLYLKGDRSYSSEERKFLNNFYNKNVKLIYGGAARNNAELFLPVFGNQTWSWGRRPSAKEILNYQVRDGEKKLMQVLNECLAVGLIFIRLNNHEVSHDRNLAPMMRILVLDRFNNRGIITVQNRGQLFFSYQKDANSKYDPLGYDGYNDGRFVGTYNQWNDISVKNNHYYHNAVAGMGAYLYSNNPAIGDLTLVRSQGWDFGDNAGGHGGLHKEEKLTMMMVSGPRIQPGKKSPDGDLMSKDSQGRLTYPTVLDIAPTVLHWLGYQETLADFSRQGFKEYLDLWVSTQKKELLDNLDNIDDLNRVLKENRLGQFKMSPFKNKLDRLLDFLPQESPELPDFKNFFPDGNLMVLDEQK